MESHRRSPLWSPTAWMLTVLLFAGCDPENNNAVACAPKDCSAACRQKGFESGTCQGERCACEPGGDSGFDWGIPDSDPSGDGSDSDSGAGDADVRADSDSDTEPGRGSDPDTLSGADGGTIDSGLQPDGGITQ